MLKTINCRDDSLIENRGMWTSMKKKKRCIVVAQGFYEWLKKNNGKEKIPHFVKRKDGQLMCFAGLWDCVKFEGGSYVSGKHKLLRMLQIHRRSFTHIPSSPLTRTSS
jgi:putative SOS response-associated peptidase YedK